MEENKLQIFENPEFGSVRTLIIDGKPYFVGKDVAEILGYKATDKAIRDHVSDEDRLTDRFGGSGQMREMVIINESGLYSLILSSKLPIAQGFKHWVTSDVLPTIRQTGGYVANDEMFVQSYLPFADEAVQGLFKLQLQVIRQLNTRITQQQEQLDTQKPQVEFAETVQKSCDNILMRDMAKLLCHEQVEIGEKRMFKLLREKEILMDDNVPYQAYIDRGYFKVKEGTYKTPYGSVKLNNTTLVTPKGQVWLTNKVREWVAA